MMLFLIPLASGDNSTQSEGISIVAPSFTIATFESIILLNIPALPLFKFAYSRTNRQVFFA
jgi:hypothetical protein